MTSLNRRALLGAAAVAGVASLPAAVVAQDGEKLPSSRAPRWSLVVHAYQDPYRGQILSPVELDPARRYLGIDIEIRNDSDIPLSASAGGVRVRSTDGVDYLVGGVAGYDPRFVDRILERGEFQRGWVFISVAKDAELTEIIYQPPSPLIVVPIDDKVRALTGATPVPEGTPSPETTPEAGASATPQNDGTGG